MSDEDVVSDFEDKNIELTVGLPGGKVHGSLARAGKYLCNLSSGFEKTICIFIHSEICK